MQEALSEASSLPSWNSRRSQRRFSPDNKGHIIGKGFDCGGGLWTSGLTIGPYEVLPAATLAFGEEPRLNLEKYDPIRKMS
ncbi:hypothetical protein [Bacillus paralicheniformis]|uniref:hypothetical protein n=1 Tax=Bacillus paralicheniformis TaxID=1648923 RepID=UPI00128DD474|nr:hypothetical protein [Bacillus paralicheniformis]MPQ26844.1 hypothetical protein [Bacillus paralicheniformis]